MSVRKRIVAATPMICVIAYLCMGFIWDLWHPGWVVFFLVPVMPCLLGTKGIRSIYPVLCVAVFLTLGIVWGYWHPGWIVFLTIPVFYTLFPIKACDEKKIGFRVGDTD